MKLETKQLPKVRKVRDVTTRELNRSLSEWSIMHFNLKSELTVSSYIDTLEKL